MPPRIGVSRNACWFTQLPRKPTEFWEILRPNRLTSLIFRAILRQFQHLEIDKQSPQPEIMTWIPPEFEAAKIPEEEKYEGTAVDANVLKGCEL